LQKATSFPDKTSTPSHFFFYTYLTNSTLFIMTKKGNNKVAEQRGPECERCGSEFELTLHHDCKKHNHGDHTKDCPVVTLCITCHDEEDFKKNLACYEKAMIKLYHKRMDKEGL